MIEFDVKLSSIETELDVQMNEGASGSGTKNYNALSNKPSINNIELVGNNTSESLGLLKKGSNVSELNNDANYISKETDPTVPDWAKQPNKPQYSAKDVGIEANTKDEPSEKLTSLKVGNKTFSISNESEKVIANPEGEATDKLEKIQIGEIIFSVSGQEYINIADSGEKF